VRGCLEWSRYRNRMSKLSFNSKQLPQSAVAICPTLHPQRNRLAPIAQSFAMRTPTFRHRDTLHAAAQPDTQSEPPR